MVCSVRHAVIVSFLLLEPALVAQTALRRPRGIYAVVNVEGEITRQQKANPSITSAQLDAYFDSLYLNLLNDPAIAGLTLQVHWDTLNPNPPSAANAYFWNYVDDAFAQAAAWDAQNPSGTPKTIQLIVTPGFQSPQWILAQIPSCDGLFQTPVATPPSTCGTATFTGFQEGGDGSVLPLPWNPVYKTAWRTFLTALAARYGPNPAFVSIAVAGPTAASAEMIVPNDANSNNPQTKFGTAITPTNMWIQLLAFHYACQTAYLKTNQAFIDEWNNAIDAFGATFSGITLVATTGDGLPNFAGTKVTIPSALAADCASNPNLDCAAETTILVYFMQPAVGGANAKATQTSGMEASRVGNGNLGVPGVKQLSQSTSQLTPASAQVLGGSQFNTTFSIDTLAEGCTSTFPPNANDTPVGCIIPPSCLTNDCIPVVCIPQACLAPGVTQADLTSYKNFNAVPGKDLISPEQAQYNVLNVYFDGTAVASSFGGTTGVAPLNYLQIYSPDIQYAQANVNAPVAVVETSGAIVSMTSQDLLNLASQQLLSISEPALLPAIDLNGVVPASSSTPTIESGEWASIFGSNLASGTAYWTGNFPTSLGGVSVTIDGKAAYLSFVSPGQINLQVPNDAATGVVNVVVTTVGGSASSSVTLSQFAPSFFLLDGKHVAGIIPQSDGSYSTIGPTGNSLGFPTVAAKAGDIVELFGTGFGPTSPAVPAGQAYSGAAPATNPVTIRINNVNVTPLFAGLSSAGLYQFNVTIPAGLGTGDIALQASVGGATTPAGVVISLR
jgi:uncharacterized protein (TIGR03437 family)